MALSQHEIEHMFGHTAASIEGPNPREEDHKFLRGLAKTLAEGADRIVPDSPEKTQAFIELQTAMMWFHKGLAHNP